MPQQPHLALIGAIQPIPGGGGWRIETMHQKIELMAHG